MRSPITEEDLRAICATELPWEEFRNRRVLITGANGFVPAYMVETLLYLNEIHTDQNTQVLAIVRDKKKAQARFAHYGRRRDLQFLVQDICAPLPPELHVDYIVHAASPASPKYFGRDPVGTVSANVLGTHQLLRLAQQAGVRGLLFFSSSEIYGEIEPSRMPIREEDCGYLDSTAVRSCYAESKRLGETMCVAWGQQHGVPVRIVRLFHTYGPGMRLDDGRVFADFVADVVSHRSIVLRSPGTASRAFCYLADAVLGVFTIMMKGENGQAYNIGNDLCECTIAELANLVVSLFPERNLEVVYQLKERGQEYLASKVSRICPDIHKARSLGWQPTTSLSEGFKRTIRSYEMPPSLTTTVSRFREGQLSKPQFIEEMHEHHTKLFEYADFLQGTEIGRIEVCDGQVIMTSRKGVHFLCDPLDRRLGPVEALNFGRYEDADAELLWSILKPEMCVFDIGANIGWYALHIGKCYPTCQVHAFEPIPSTFSLLKQNLALNALSNVHLYNFGLSDHAGPATFYFYPEGSAGASAADNSRRASVRRLECTLRQLDDFVKESAAVPDLIKCDIEGGELFAFRGGIESLRRYRPVLFCEMLRKWTANFGYHPNDIIDLLGSLGYTCFSVDCGRLVHLPQIDDQTVATNFYFLHKQNHADIIERFATAR